MQQYVSSASSKTSAKDELIKENNVKVFPNPANETIQISGIKENETSVIYNILGVKVIETKQKNIDISKLESGFYIVITEAGDKVKFLKQ